MPVPATFWLSLPEIPPIFRSSALAPSYVPHFERRDFSALKSPEGPSLHMLCLVTNVKVSTIGSARAPFAKASAAARTSGRARTSEAARAQARARLAIDKYGISSPPLGLARRRAPEPCCYR